MKKHAILIALLGFVCIPLLTLSVHGQTSTRTYVVVDTGQENCYGESGQIEPPEPGQSFHGQDAQYQGVQPSYQNSADGLVVTDLNTGLIWQKTPDFSSKLTYAQALAGAGTFTLGGHDDWRLPTIKELYSLIDFRGSAPNQVPYIDTDHFDFQWGDTSAGERDIDAQYWSSTAYVGTTMNGNATAFGVNFADGRIKGYGQTMAAFVRYVRGGNEYGVNRFVDNGDGTVTDEATGLMWQKADSGATMNWGEALAHAESLSLASHDDWRLPNAKEMQSIIDYTRAPDATDPANRGPAIDTELFSLTTTESWFWTGTTHLDSVQASTAVYLCVGQAYGYMPAPSGTVTYMNVHGAGAQRSDPKSGSPSEWPTGNGPQGDEVRIYNYVRAVRNAGSGSGSGGGSGDEEPPVVEPPVITASPVSVTVKPEATARFEVTATGSGMLRYQWQKDGSDLSGETSSVLVIDDARAWDAGAYNCVVINEGGQVITDIVTLTVNLPPPPPRPRRPRRR